MADPGSRRINWRNGLFFLFVHAVALLAFLPWFFSWTGVAVFVLGIYAIGVLGINVGFHRLLTHRGFACPRWVECTLAVLGCCSGQEAPAFWVAVHRKHHHHADGPEDPHSPLRGFLWGHIGWLLVKDDQLHRNAVIDRYARDLKRDPFHAWLVRHDLWVFLFFISWIAFMVVGFAAAAATGSTIAEAVQFGLSLMVWGGAVRTVLVWHMTWSINSVHHLWGYRNYETRDSSRNSVWIGIVSAGEGYHNNHHADPRSARHGHKWWEFDLAWQMIRLMMVLGLAKDVAVPSPILATRFSGAAPQAALPDFADAEEPPPITAKAG